VVGHVFSARVLARYATYTTLGVTAIITILKILVIYFDQGLLFFASTIALEVLLLSIIYTILYHTVLKESWRSWRVSLPMARSLIRDSWPVMLVGVTGYLYMRIDQVMLKHFIGAEAVGLYEAAVRLTEPLGIIPGVIMGSLFPAIINARGHDRAEYRRRLRALAVLCLSISGILAFLLFLMAPLLVAILYGAAYTESATILRIYAWSTVGTIAMALMFNYFVAENRTHMQIIFTTFGAGLNIALNSYLIPTLGLYGAAYATLITVSIVMGIFISVRSLR
jgi:O-antigen/teichoic acid export membrane protein